jgi:hypothetical protein
MRGDLKTRALRTLAAGDLSGYDAAVRARDAVSFSINMLERAGSRRRAAMTVESQVIHKTRLDARITSAPTPAPPFKRAGGFVQRQHAAGAVDLAYSAALPEWATQAARIMDVVKTADAAVDILAEAIAQHLAKQRRTTDAQIAALDTRLAAAESENATLKQGIVELRGEIADLTHSIERDRRARGVGDGASLPASLVRKNRAAAKASR